MPPATLELRLAGATAATPLVRPAVLGAGFRPFFLLASWYGAANVLLWVAQYLGWWSMRPALPAMLWHGHEMLFGFAAAAVGGFLLTAVPNWTGHATPRGSWLGVMALTWVLGRIVCLTWWVPLELAAVVDLAYLPGLGLALARPLVQARQFRNLIFLPVLGFLTLTNAMIWADALGWAPGSSRLGLEWALLAILQLVVIIAGRVVPFFTRAALPESRPRQWKAVDGLALASLPLIALAEGMGWPSGALCLGFALVHGVRLVGWHNRAVWRVPLLWVLYVGYGWLAAGLALKGWAVSPYPAMHALTVGCVGTLILGMMARVALGHTGRELRAPQPVAVAFGLLALAAPLRALGPLLVPSPVWVSLSAVLWSLAFALYGTVYFPILTRPRVDGRAG